MLDSRPNTPLLDGIQSPADLKKLASEDLPKLAQELRETILYTVQTTGGHLGSGMGAVELTIALHYVFDLLEDRVVWDVGHQCYPHKLLTGRKDRFDTLRQKDGLSGFCNRFESPYDPYLMGHAGTATSAALGIGIGDRLLGRERHVLSVVGDAAMGCGVAFEALNHAGTVDGQKLTVILNDNRWSITKTVGALSRHLNKVRSGRFYNQAKETLHKLIQSIPLVGEKLDNSIEQGVEMLRTMVYPGHIFEELGFRYFGPIDGHDVHALIDIFEKTRAHQGVVLIHINTVKGKGVPGSEDRYDRAHAAKPQPKKVAAEPWVIPAAKPVSRAAAKAGAGRSWTQWFGEAVERAAERDPRVVAITAAMPDGTGLMKFAERFPDRFFDAGIAEQHAVAMASGMATAGLRPVAAIYSTFLQRGYDQVFQEVVLQQVPVVFAMDRAGLVGEDGATHNGLYDIAYLRTFPHMVLMAPKDGPELGEMLDLALGLEGPTGIRYGRGEAPGPDSLPGWDGHRLPVELGRMEVLRTGPDGAILAYGHMVKPAMEAAQILERGGTRIEVINARFVKPLDEEGIIGLADRHENVLTLEDHSAMGGFGSAVLECISRHGPVRANFQVLGVPDRQLLHMSRKEILLEVGLDAPAVAARFLSGQPTRLRAR